MALIAKVTVTDNNGIVQNDITIDPDEAEGLGISTDQYLREVIEVVCDGVAGELQRMIELHLKEDK